MNEDAKIWKEIDKIWNSTDTSECGPDGEECDESMCTNHHDAYRADVASRFRLYQLEKDIAKVLKALGLER